MLSADDYVYAPLAKDDFAGRRVFTGAMDGCTSKCKLMRGFACSQDGGRAFGTRSVCSLLPQGSSASDADSALLAARRTVFDARGLTSTELAAVGHQLQHLIVSCTYDGVDCKNASQWQARTDPKLGMCYTWNGPREGKSFGDADANQKSRKAGRSSGLSLVVDPEECEYTTSRPLPMMATSQVWDTAGRRHFRVWR